MEMSRDEIMSFITRCPEKFKNQIVTMTGVSIYNVLDNSKSVDFLIEDDLYNSFIALSEKQGVDLLENIIIFMNKVFAEIPAFKNSQIVEDTVKFLRSNVRSKESFVAYFQMYFMISTIVILSSILKLFLKKSKNHVEQERMVLFTKRVEKGSKSILDAFKEEIAASIKKKEEEK